MNMRWDWDLVIVNAAPTIAALAALVASLRNNKKIKDLHILINSGLAQRITDAVMRGRQIERDTHTITVEGIPKNLT